ncbi:acyltransferase family protein [Prevotella aurantiaca]
MTKFKSERIIYFDAVKFLAVWMVCIGHSYYLVDLVQPSKLYQWIYSFHMPLFMFLCGYFSSHSYKKPFKEFLKQKSIQLIVPAISISLITILVCVIIGSPNIKIIAKSEIIGGMWFLRTLFLCSIYSYVIKRLCSNDILAAIGSILVGLFFPHGYFLQFNWMLIIFWAGYFFKAYYKFYEKYLSIFTISSLIIFIFFCEHKVPQVLTYDVLLITPNILPRQLLTGLSGTLSIIGCTYYFCMLLGNNNIIIQKIANIGKYTLGIYGLQSIILQRLFVHYLRINLGFLPEWISDFVIVPTIAIITLLICYFLILYTKKNKILNIFMYGNQYK